MFPLLLALIVFALAGAGATVLLRTPASEVDDLPQGLEYLAGLRWGDFIRLVLRAMHAAGYATIGEDGNPNDGLMSDGKDILLKRGTQRTLLSCKLGSSSIVSAQAVLGLGKSAQLRGASAAIVVTPGHFDAEARRVAAQQQVELIDGEQLWPKVKPFIPHHMLPAGKAKPANSKASRLAWAGAAVLGVSAGLLAFTMQAPIQDDADSNAAIASAVAARAPARRATAAPVAAAVDQIPTDAAALEKRRREVADTISTLAGVDRANWSTQSTILVTLSSADANPVAQLCPLLERYAELASSRVQLQPPLDSERPVRFIQCRSY
ncbi:MAG: restriction endonuclease [Thermomonas sp.]